jgi:hypothetical protein
VTNARSAATVLNGTMRPVRGLADGMPSIVIEKRAVSESTSMRCVLRSIVGSAQISSLVLSGPMPREAQGRGDIDVGGKAARAVARGTVKHLARGIDAF